MKKSAIAIIAGSVLVLAACSGAPSPRQGYVYSINYNAPSEILPYYVRASESCTDEDNEEDCTAIPGYWTMPVFIPAEWQLELCRKPGAPDKNNNTCGWRDVDEQVYDSIRLGQYYAIPGSK